MAGLVSAAAHAGQAEATEDASDARYVWWEAELPGATNFPKRTSFSPRDAERSQLSGGDWLTNNGARTGRESYARYNVRVPRSGAYDLWVRKFWKHGPFRWRFDDQPWRVCGRDVALADQIDIREHLCANWVALGEVELKAGAHAFDIRLLAERGETLAAGFDCFVLSRGAFMPNGAIKPDDPPIEVAPGFFAWPHVADPFEDSALLDLRRLNESSAGVHGRVTARAGGYRLGDGTPVRFWAINLFTNNAAQDRRSVDYAARRLAKLGVNMVRFHSPIFDRGRSDESLDEAALDDLFYLVAAMKREGIYVTLSTWSTVWFKVRDASGLAGYADFDTRRPFAVLYFNERMQSLYHGWMRSLLGTTNPYTGLSLADDPAVAIVELVNEDSLLFWTFSRRRIPTEQWSLAERRFTAWLVRRYGSVDAAFDRWGRVRAPNDDESAGHVGLLEPWDLTTDGLARGGAAKRRRAGDQATFLVELQRGFYDRTIGVLRELGYHGLVSASNWTTSDESRLGPLEQYTYAVGDVIDRHGYFGGDHEGPGAGHSVRIGHTFASRAAVNHPGLMPVQAMQLAGYPQNISELGWPNPNRYRADATLLSAAYGALQGIDGIYHFGLTSNYVQETSMRKFAASSPVIAATFPATALLYRRGDVTEPEPVLHQVLDVARLLRLEGDVASANPALDASRRVDLPSGASDDGDDGEPPDPRSLAFFAGPVTRTIERHPRARSTAVDLSERIDTQDERILSVTGELDWRYGDGLVLVRTERCLAAAGFLGDAGTIDLGGVVLRCGNEFASIVVIALDDLPIARSRRVLIQAMTEDRPFGFETAAHGGSGRVVEALGGAPMMVRAIDASVTVRSGRPASLAVLDPNGYGMSEHRARLDRSDASITVHLDPNSIYHVLTFTE